ncbi:MAG: DJ-1/PfpI family protein [Pseudonocardia sp.]|nr:DJ-1/PfpI family protein [Pseudonocardia sp.]
MQPHRVVFLVFDGVKTLDVSGPAEVFAEASRIAGAHYVLQYVSPSGRAVTTSTGMRLAVDSSAEEIAAAETVIVSGGDRLPLDPIGAEMVASTRHLAGLGRRVASICTGAFLLAAAGTLEGRRATTHWQHTGLLQRAFPAIRVEPDLLFVQDGRFHTSAGVSAGIDLALSFIEHDHGPEIARRVAQQLVVHLRRHGGQSQFSVALQTPVARTEIVRRVLGRLQSDPAGDHGVPALARSVGVSERHLNRLCNAELGLSPAKLVENHRLEYATTLLLDGSSVAVTARRSGFGTPETLRRVFVARFGLSPSAYRQHFASSDR